MKTGLAILLLFSIPLISVNAQTTVVFNVDMRAAIQDSTFIPDQDYVQIKGTLYPLGLRSGTRMRDEAPIDSVYSVEVRFSRQHSNKRLSFNFEIVKPNNKLSEQGPRSILLNDENINIQPLGFNSFAF